jgi:hypothetical protein
LPKGFLRLEHMDDQFNLDFQMLKMC